MDMQKLKPSSFSIFSKTVRLSGLTPAALSRELGFRPDSLTVVKGESFASEFTLVPF
jgi:hypothetical protein